jgi:pimeloyl-ACP methyl ester carboxylesterase
VAVAEVNGTALHYETHGNSGPLLVLVMGLRVRGLAWRPIVDHLSKDHRLAWYDHRGVGDSRSLDAPTSIAQMAADTVGLMDHLGWGTAHVAGVSMGGMIAQQLILNHPGRARSATFIVTTAHGKALQRTSLKALWRYSGTFFGSREKRLGALARMLYSAEYLEDSGFDSVVEGMKDAFGLDHPGTATAQIRAIRGHDTRPRLSEMDLPMLVIGAGADCIIPERHPLQLHAQLRDAEYVSFPRACHGVIAEEAEAVSEQISRLVARTEAKMAQRGEGVRMLCP